MVPMASSKTAGSTQPPLTDPTTCPSSETAIEVPGPSVPERSTFTTVARAAFFPSSRQLAILSMTGFKECLLSVGSMSACQHFSTLRLRLRLSAFQVSQSETSLAESVLFWDFLNLTSFSPHYT